LVVVLIYEWGIGALNIGPDTKRILKVYRKKKILTEKKSAI
jgi:NADH-quinone oxidoreductase subunit A